MSPIIWLISTVLFVYMWIILAMVILSWLTSFGVVNGSNPTVRQIRYALFRLTEPVLGPIRRVLPDLGGIDISPIIAALGLEFLRRAVEGYLAMYI